MKCKDCKFWYDSRGEWCFGHMIINPIDPDTDDPMEMPFEVRECKSPKITLFERNPDPSGVSLTDASEYFARMCTGPDFGCVNFERKN